MQVGTLRDLLFSVQRSYFVNREEALEMFRKLVQTPVSLRLYHILVMLGPGGIGKTVLLEEFKHICGEYGIPNSIASMDICHSPMGLLTALRANWDSRPKGKDFRDFDKLMSRFKDLQKRLLEKGRAGGNVSEMLGEVLGGVSATTLGGAIGGLSLGPLGALLGAAAGILTKEVLESSTTTLLKAGLISHRDVDFLNSMLSNLVSAFAHGANRLAAQERGMVLILDAYEYAQKAEHLDEWITGYLLPGLTERTLIVIAGRRRMEGKFWQTYSSFVYQRQLEPFDKPVLVEYLRVRGLAGAEADALLDLTAGLPLGAALWADIETQEQPEKTAAMDKRPTTDLLKAVVDRLLEDIEDTPRGIIRICAIPRQFDEGILEYLVPSETLPITFEHLCKLSSIFRLRPHGLSMHEEVRRWLVEDFSHANTRLYTDLNLKMARFFEEKAASEVTYSAEWFEHQIERLYHLLAAQDKARYELLRAIVDDAADMYDTGLLESLNVIISDSPEALSTWGEMLASMITFVRRDFVSARERLSSLSQKDSISSIIRAQSLFYLCATLWYLGEYRAALSAGEEALALYRQLKDRRGEYEVCERLGWIHQHLGNCVDAIATQEKGLEIARALHDRLGEGWALNGLGGAHLIAGHIRHAEDLFQQAFSIWTDLDNAAGQFYALLHLGDAHAESGRFSSAAHYITAALESWPRCDDEVLALERLGQIRSVQGEYDQAFELLNKSIRYCREKRKPYLEARAERYLGEAHLAQRDWDKTLEHYARVIELCQKLDTRLVQAKALGGILRTRYFQDASPTAIQEAVAVAEAIAQENEYHDMLAEVYLYQGLAEVREALRSTQEEEISGDHILKMAQMFIRAMSEGLQYNSYILDKTLREMLSALQVLDSTITSRICQRIAILWRSGKLDTLSLVKAERKLRERDALPDNQTSVLEQLATSI
ncbi:tetratricopeptide repeat protein [Dehalococcoidia bacterium]|nr:tetratricopeptide repeat protein [Dehalococcoidia bacterium]